MRQKIIVSVLFYTLFLSRRWNPRKPTDEDRGGWKKVVSTSKHTKSQARASKIKQKPVIVGSRFSSSSDLPWKQSGSDAHIRKDERERWKARVQSLKHVNLPAAYENCTSVKIHVNQENKMIAKLSTLYPWLQKNSHYRVIFVGSVP